MIARKSVVTFGNSILGGLIGLLAILAIGRYVADPGIVGQVAYPLALLGILHYVTSLGFNKAHVKRVSEGQDEADCFATFGVFKIASTAVFILLAFGLYWYQFHLRGVGFQNIAVTAFFFLVIHFTLLSLRATFHYTFEARTEAVRVQTILFVDTVVRVSATVVVAVLFAAVTADYGPLADRFTADTTFGRFIAHFPAGALAATYALGTALSLVVAAVGWRWSGGRVGRFRWDLLHGYWVFALPLMVYGIINTLAGKIDRLALGYFLVDADVGIYDLPQRFTKFVEAIPLAVAAILFPYISAMDARGERSRVKETTERSLRYLSMIVLPITVFSVLFPEQLIRIFIGSAFLPGAPVLSLLIVYTFVMALARPFFALTTGLGRSDLMARAGIVMAVSNIALNVLLIPEDIRRLGITLPGLRATGAALATLISGALGLALLWIAARSIVGSVRVPGFTRHAIAAGVMGLTLTAMNAVPVLALTRWYDVLLYTLTGAVVYFGILLLLREFTRDDHKFFMEALNVRKLVNYVRSELR